MMTRLALERSRFQALPKHCFESPWRPVNACTMLIPLSRESTVLNERSFPRSDSILAEAEVSDAENRDSALWILDRGLRESMSV
jgi:hypothetical protein